MPQRNLPTAAHSQRSRRRQAASSRQQKSRTATTARIMKQTPSRKRKPAAPKQKKYRRVKVFRPCVARLVFLVPLCILLFERYLGFTINLDDVREAYYDQMGIDPWQIPLPLDERIGTVPDAGNISYSPQHTCPSGQQRMMTVQNPQHLGLSYRQIPNMIHQTAKTRCLTRNFERATIQWAFRRYSYYIHDMHSVNRLFRRGFPEFPQLNHLSDCIAPALKVGLWKYLSLWLWGGIYADLNAYPIRFNATSITNDDDGFFLVEEDSEILTTQLMAVSPRHPLIYLAIQHAITNISRMRPGQMYNLREIVGEGALNQALSGFLSPTHRKFLRRKSTEKGIKVGILEGKNGRSIRIGGSLGETDGFVSPIFITEAGKQKELAKMDMDYTTDAIAGSNCWASSLSEGTRANVTHLENKQIFLQYLA